MITETYLKKKDNNPTSLIKKDKKFKILIMLFTTFSLFDPFHFFVEFILLNKMVQIFV